MSRPLWTAAEAAQAVGGRLVEGSDWTASGVEIDSRELRPGDLFAAITARRDGHDFAPDAMARGATAALVSREDACEGPRLVVDDVFAALRLLGEAARERARGLRIGVTGSVGKTSVKEALAAVFREAGPAHWSVKSFNNHWGVPLTLARMPAETARAVFEMGMNHAGEIEGLTSQVRPHIALITKIAPAHLENLGSMEAIADAKAEIFSGLAEDGVAVTPADDEFAERLSAAAARAGAGFLLDFGRSPNAAVRLLDHRVEGEGARARIDVVGKPVEVAFETTGEHHAVNAAGVLAAAFAAGVEPGFAAEILSRQRAVAGRGAAFEIALEDGGRAVVIDDSYNANPASMEAAIAALARRAPKGGGRRVAVLGEMLELGPEAEAMHRALSDPLKAAGAGDVIGVGALMRALVDSLPAKCGARYASDPDRALDMLTAGLRDGDVVLVKGSNASGVHKIAAALRETASTAPTEA